MVMFHWFVSFQAGKSSWYSLIALEVEKPHSNNFIPSAPGSLPSQPHRSLPRCCPSQLVMFWWQRDSPPLHTLGGNPRGKKKNIRCHWWKVCFVKTIFTKKNKILYIHIHPKFHRNLLELFQNSLYGSCITWMTWTVECTAHESPSKKSLASFPTIPYEWSSQLLVH